MFGVKTVHLNSKVFGLILIFGILMLNYKYYYGEKRKTDSPLLLIPPKFSSGMLTPGKRVNYENNVEYNWKFSFAKWSDWSLNIGFKDVKEIAFPYGNHNFSKAERFNSSSSQW